MFVSNFEARVGFWSWHPMINVTIWYCIRLEVYDLWLQYVLQRRGACWSCSVSEFITPEKMHSSWQSFFLWRLIVLPKLTISMWRKGTKKFLTRWMGNGCFSQWRTKRFTEWGTPKVSDTSMHDVVAEEDGDEERPVFEFSLPQAKATTSEAVTFSIPVDSEHKAKTVRVFSFAAPHMRSFHLSWISFFTCFLSSFAVAPLMPVIRDNLNLNRSDIGHAAIASVTGEMILARLGFRWDDSFTARVSVLCSLIPYGDLVAHVFVGLRWCCNGDEFSFRTPKFKAVIVLYAKLDFCYVSSVQVVLHVFIFFGWCCSCWILHIKY